MKLYDWLYNRIVLRRWHAQCAEFPRVFGRILVADFTKHGRGGTLKFGRRVVINSGLRANPVGGVCTVFLFKGPGNPVIELDDGAGVSNVMFGAYTGIYVGKDVNLGAGVKVIDNDFHSLDFEERMADVNIKSAPIRIEAGAFVGTEAMILKGVTIGERSVIAAGSIVVKSVPPGEIWGGNPAKFIRKL